MAVSIHCTTRLSLGRQPGQDGRPQGAAGPSVLAHGHLLILTSLLPGEPLPREEKGVNGPTSRVSPLQMSTPPSYIQAPLCLPGKVPRDPSSDVPREYVRVGALHGWGHQPEPLTCRWSEPGEALGPSDPASLCSALCGPHSSQVTHVLRPTRPHLGPRGRSVFRVHCQWSV